MYYLIRSMNLHRILSEQLPAIAISLIIAELFYKFHSFILEGIAFLITWFLVDAMIQAVIRLFSKWMVESPEKNI